MTYSPKPGTAAFRILGWLEAQGETREFTSAQIAEALDIPAQTLGSYMEQSVAAGLVFRRQKDRTHPRAPVWWSLTNHGVRQRMEMSPHPVGWMTRPPKDDDDVPTFRGRATDTPQPDSQQVLKADAARRDATDRETPATTSPGVGPMGAGQPADAGPTCDESAAQQEAPTHPGRVEPAATPPAAPPLPPLVREEPREVDEQFARSIDAALADPEMRFALWDDDTLICVARGAVQWRCTPEQTQRLRQLLGYS